MLKLISGELTYEEVYKLEDESEDKWPVFTLSRLSAAQVNNIDDQVTRAKASKGSANNAPDVHFLGGTARRLKIEVALKDWKNVQDEAGVDAKCTNVTKGQLPAEIQTWLEEKIDDANKLKGIGEDERKNS